MQYFIALFLIPIIIMSSCGRKQDYVNDLLQKADSVIETAPNISLEIINSIPETDLISNDAKARFALLKSMALDKNYLDTTTFDILDPAIDYYINKKKGTADERLRTLYYQGRIFQNRQDDEMAMNSYISAIDLSHETTDVLTLGRAYGARAVIYEKQGLLESYALCCQEAANIFMECNKDDDALDMLSGAINANIFLDKKNAADSLISVVYNKCKGIPEDNPSFIHAKIMYAGKFLSESEYEHILDSISERLISMKSDSDDLYLDLANGYYEIGDNEKAMNLIGLIQTPDKSNLKYLLIKSNILQARTEYRKALQSLWDYISNSDSINTIVFSQEIRSVEDKYILEKKILEEKLKRSRNIFQGVILLFILVFIIFFIAYRYKSIKIKNFSLNEKNLQLELNNIKIKKENAIVRNENHALEEEKKKLERERDKIQDILSQNTSMSKSLYTVMQNRLNILNGLLASKITSNKEYSKAYDQIEHDLLTNKKVFLKTLRDEFEKTYPKFYERLIDARLTERELNYVSLYILGLRGKEIGIYLDTQRQYVISSAIRAKLGLDKSHNTLSNYIQTEISRYPLS